jgi:hypothetical protein
VIVLLYVLLERKQATIESKDSSPSHYLHRLFRTKGSNMEEDVWAQGVGCNCKNKSVNHSVHYKKRVIDPAT